MSQYVRVHRLGRSLHVEPCSAARGSPLSGSQSCYNAKSSYEAEACMKMCCDLGKHLLESN